MVDLGGKTLIYMIQKLCVISLLELILGMRVLSLFPFLPSTLCPSLSFSSFDGQYIDDRSEFWK